MMFRCFGSCRSLACFVDTLLHTARLNVRSICDRHDRQIMKGC